MVGALYYCIAVARCGLCGFEIEDGDLVVVGTNVDDVSAKFSFQKGCDAGVVYMYYPVHACCRTCHQPNHLRSVVPCHHASCFRLNPSGVLPELLSVTNHDFESLALECRRREAFFQPLIIDKLRDVFAPVHLPTEIWIKIAAHLVRECAIVTAQTQVQKYKDKALDCLIDLSKDVYASYVLFDGVRYIQSLRNITKAEAEEGEYRILDASKAGTVDKMYTAFDHLGIRELQFAAPNRVLPSPESILGVWWRHVSMDGITELNIEADVLKVRNIDVSGSAEATSQFSIGWPVREPGSAGFFRPSWTDDPGRGEDVVFRNIVSRTGTIPADLRMARIECNSPSTRGYSVAAVGDGVCFIHAHGEGDANPDYDRFGSRVSHWIYMPINPGEYVEEIWVSNPRYDRLNKSAGLTFITNRGRVTSFAPWAPKRERSHDQCPYECIHKPQKGGSPIYFNIINPALSFSRHGRDSEYVFHFAVESPEPPVQRAYPKSFIPTSPPMEVKYSEERFFSSCSLENVVEVTLCRSQGGYPDGIIGMLVRYANNDRACVGAFRFDWASETCHVGEAKRLYIGCSQEPRWVKDVRVEPPAEGSELSWMAVPWSGKLEWWFSREQSAVYHI